MRRRGWQYERLEELCDDYERLFQESLHAYRLCQSFQELSLRALRALAEERGRRPNTFLPWDYAGGWPRAWDLS